MIMKLQIFLVQNILAFSKVSYISSPSLHLLLEFSLCGSYDYNIKNEIAVQYE